MSITKEQLFFDPANLAESDKSGAYLIGAGGTVIGNDGDSLKVKQAALDFLTDSVDVSGSTVELGAASLAALENITVEVSNEVEITNDVGNPIPVSGTVALDAGTLAALEQITVSATDFDIRDLSHTQDSVRLGDGTDFLDINSDGSISTRQKAGAAIENTALTVSTTALALGATPLANRTRLLIQNLGNRNIAVGKDNTVTFGTGVIVPAGASADFPWGPSVIPYAITDSGSSSVRLMETA